MARNAKEDQEKIIANVRKWQKVENAAVAVTGRVIEKTENPIIRLVMEIIQQDSQMHHRAQQLIADSLESRVISLTPEELAEVWGVVEEHIRIEKETITLAKAALEMTGSSKGLLVQRYLLEYLLKDEEKHDAILANLEAIKKDMYPYG
jgi:bacterioferritin (cytochrome b1)